MAAATRKKKQLASGQNLIGLSPRITSHPEPSPRTSNSAVYVDIVYGQSMTKPSLNKRVKKKKRYMKETRNRKTYPPHASSHTFGSGHQEDEKHWLFMKTARNPIAKRQSRKKGTKIRLSQKKYHTAQGAGIGAARQLSFQDKDETIEMMFNHSGEEEEEQLVLVECIDKKQKQVQKQVQEQKLFFPEAELIKRVLAARRLQRAQRRWKRDFDAFRESAMAISRFIKCVLRMIHQKYSSNIMKLCFELSFILVFLFAME